VALPGRESLTEEMGMSGRLVGVVVDSGVMGRGSVSGVSWVMVFWEAAKEAMARARATDRCILDVGMKLVTGSRCDSSRYLAGDVKGKE
jgi:hypothetical protein